jgi:hypothetical protein
MIPLNGGSKELQKGMTPASSHFEALKESHACTVSLVQDQYGNYGTQHVIEHGTEDRVK